MALGGCELAVILPETGRASAERFIERLSKTSDLSATAGLAALPCENLMAAADADLVSRKRNR